MKVIKIIGLGPGDPKHISRKAWEILSSSDELLLRTNTHPVAQALPSSVRVESFDKFYTAITDFDEIYERIVGRVIELADKRDTVVYAVPGDPNVGESTVALLRDEARRRGIQVDIIPGISFIEPSLDLLEIDALDGLYIADALSLAAGHHPPFSPDIPALVAQLYSQNIAADVKLTLMNQYADDHPAALLHHVATEQAQVENLVLYEIDRSEFIDGMTTLYLPPVETSSSFEAFQETVAHLRAPDGCPWDREQTHESLRKHILEEAYEVLQAIDNQDLDALKEELGDLLLQIVLQAQIAGETGVFRMSDILRGINSKIIRRHPHVFEGMEVNGIDQVLHNWEALKAVEREANGRGEGILDGIPGHLPALAQANEIQSRAARVGFAWPALKQILNKIEEQYAEVKEARELDEQSKELGDLFFALVNYAQWLDIDPESALRATNKRFQVRFSRMENSIIEQGKNLSEIALNELEHLWQEQKG